MRVSRLTPHPGSARLASAIQQYRSGIAVAENVFRFTDMTYANLKDLITGEGSRKAGGRWNPKGSFPTLYFSLDPETALAEALAQHRSQNMPDIEATPLVLTGCRVDVQSILDLTNPGIRRLLSVTMRQLCQPWRPLQHAGQEALTQAIGRLARAHGFQGLLAPSAAHVVGRNLVLFRDKVSDNELTIVKPREFPQFRRRFRRK